MAPMGKYGQFFSCLVQPLNIIQLSQFFYEVTFTGGRPKCSAEIGRKKKKGFFEPP
jgi:hypothetical protein